MEQKIMELVERIAHVAERHGVASLQMDTDDMKRLTEEYFVLKEAIRNLLRPQWGVGSIAAQRQAQQAQINIPPPKTATQVMLDQYQQMLKQMTHKQQMNLLNPYPFLSPEEEEEQESTNIEFSL